MTPVLLLVDLQRDYLSAPGLEPSAGQIVERASALLEGCRAARIPVVHVWTTVSREPDDRMPHWKQLGKWQCVAGTAGHEPPATLAPTTTEQVVHKQFFSAFADNALTRILTEAKADAVIIAGTHIHACVRQTALDAYAKGLEVWIAADAVGSDDPLHAAITRRYLQSRAARFLSTDEILGMVTRRDGPAISANISSNACGTVTRVARQAFAHGSRSTPATRRQCLEDLAARVEHNAAAWAEQMAREIGKPVFYGRIEAVKAAELVRSIAQSASVTDTTFDARIRRRPLGVVATITPWNNPLLIPLGKIAAAVFHGNAVVWKPAPAAAGLAERLMECFRETDWPAGLVSMMTGDSNVAAALMANPGVDAVTLTGGMQAGYCAQEICARRHIPLQAELGGNNAAIVWADADLEDAARRIAEGAFGQAGQRCTANRRAIVDQACFARFLELIAAATSQLRLGDPHDDATRIGPLISVRECQRVKSLVARAVPGASLLDLPATELPTGADADRYHAPTIICCDDPAHEIVQEETFGPVLVIQKAIDWAAALELCNGVRQGLAAAVFTTSAERRDEFLERAEAGILKVNQSTADADVTLPFGGWKASGIGPPEHGIADREFYTRLQAVYGHAG
jgi:acyl-CoA reductase-like NAD-dependent aldehyde dehydrogenase/nicotinamidase-related amidase